MASFTSFDEAQIEESELLNFFTAVSMLSADVGLLKITNWVSTF
jgi:hypothetical protein